MKPGDLVQTRVRWISDPYAHKKGLVIKVFEFEPDNTVRFNQSKAKSFSMSATNIVTILVDGKIQRFKPMDLKKIES